MTGTPIQNRLEDLGSLVAFLRIAPFDDMAEFRRHIVAPIADQSSQGTRNLRVLLDTICLRRTKIVLDLPDLVSEERVLDLSEEERNIYSTTSSQTVAAIKEQVMSEKGSKAYLGIFQLQLRLRRICNHGTFTNTALDGIVEEAAFDAEEALWSLKDSTDAACAYCNLRVSGMTGEKQGSKGYFTVCGHLLCSKCIPQFEEKLIVNHGSNNSGCPLCLKQISKDYLVQSKKQSKVGNADLKAMNLNKSGISTKITSLVKDVEDNISTSKG